MPEFLLPATLPPMSDDSTNAAGASWASERRVVLLVAAVQFVNVLDFMMVMPLGPDFAKELGIDVAHLGLIGGIYTLAAAVSGIVGSLFLDRYDRRTALALSMLGLALGTALGGFSTGLGSLLAARVVAGLFGGPATSLSLAIVTDLVPVERRGRALGIVMAAFSVSSVLGVPAGLELARLAGFRAPFFAVALLIVGITAASIRVMPRLRGHLGRRSLVGGVPRFFDAKTLVSLSNTALVMLGVFAVVPNISAFVQFNLGYPREHIGLLYLVGGIVSFAGMRATGLLVDRFGPVPLVFLGTALHLFALYRGFVVPPGVLPIWAIFAVFMLSGSVRMVPLQTLSTQVPAPETRARFMSAQSAVQHLASSLGAFASSALLETAPDGRLVGMARIVAFAAGLAALVPFGAAYLQKLIRPRGGLLDSART